MARLSYHAAVVVLVAAAVADARTLRHRGTPSSLAHTDALPETDVHNPCAAWLQMMQGQAPATVAAAGPPPCPCLATPPPLMTPEQTQAIGVKGAADNAMLKGLTRIQEAAVGASAPVMAEVAKLNEKEVEQAAEGAFNAVEQNETQALKTVLGKEKLRQQKEMEEMEAGAVMVAQMNADHVRETTEQWARNQARNYLVLSANGTMNDALEITDRTAKIRQEATELTKGAIKSAAQSLEVAKKAQEAIAHVPFDQMHTARKYAEASEEEQKELNKNIEATESTIRKVALVATEGYKVAQETLREADEAERVARVALETSRANAVKIEKLKTRASSVSNKAKLAETNYKASLH